MRSRTLKVCLGCGIPCLVLLIAVMAQLVSEQRFRARVTAHFQSSSDDLVLLDQFEYPTEFPYEKANQAAHLDPARIDALFVEYDDLKTSVPLAYKPDTDKTATMAMHAFVYRVGWWGHLFPTSVCVTYYHEGGQCTSAGFSCAGFMKLPVDERYINRK